MAKPNPDELDALQRRLSAAQGEAQFHQDRTVYLERRLAELEDALAAFEMHDNWLAYTHTDGEMCAVEITCPSVREVLDVLLAGEVASRSGE